MARELDEMKRLNALRAVGIAQARRILNRLIVAPLAKRTAYFQEVTSWAQLERYSASNDEINKAAKRPDIVFIGDSITERWQASCPEMFDLGRLNRGISGQTTPQMLVRFNQDALALHPRMVVIAGGTNDVALNLGAISADMTISNIVAMVCLACSTAVIPVLTSIPPATVFPWRLGIDPRPPIAALNRRLATFALASRISFVDYDSVLGDGTGGMRRTLTDDGVHPNARGYAAMRPLLEAAIAAGWRVQSKEDCRHHQA